MIRNLLATTAIATLAASGAFAQTTAPTADPTVTDQPPVEMVVRAEGHLASEIMGETVYNGTGEDAENIGAVRDIVFDDEGNIEAIVVGVGGFLGIAQKEVALQYDLVEWAEQEGERWLVVETTTDALRAQEEFDRAAYRPMPADADVAVTEPATKEDLAAAPTPEEGADDTAMAPADDEAGDATAIAPADEEADTTAAAPADEEADTTAAAPADEEADTTAAAPADEEAGEETAGADQGEPAGEEETTAMTPEDQAGETDATQTGAIDRSTLQEVETDQIRTEDLTGTTVYGANEENIGSIGDVIVTQEGDVDAVLVDVGGFLGVGSKEVAIGMDNLAFMTDEDGDFYLYTEFTQEELEAQPEYDEATYSEQRDEMRLQVQ